MKPNIKIIYIFLVLSSLVLTLVSGCTRDKEGEQVAKGFRILSYEQSHPCTLFMQWEGSYKSDAYLYRVLKRLPRTDDFFGIKDTFDTGIEINLMAEDQDYFIKVQALDTKDEITDETEPVLVRLHTAVPAPLISQTGIGSVRLSWEDVEGITSCPVYRSESPGEDYIKIGETEENTFIDNELLEGKRYLYKIGGITELGCRTGLSSAVGIVPATEILGLEAHPVRLGCVELSWQGITGAEKYEVFRGLWEREGYEYIAETTTSNFTDKAVPEGERFFYRVRGVAKNGTRSIMSKPVDMILKPHRIRGLRCEQKGIGLVELNWDDIQGIKNYTVLRSESERGKFDRIGESRIHEYIDSGLKEGETYYYRVKGLSQGGIEALPSASAKITPSTPVPQFRATQKGIGSVKLEWGAVEGASGYMVYRAQKGGEVEHIGKANNSTLSYIDMGLTEGDTYYYRIMAANTEGDLSQLSDPIYITPESTIENLSVEQLGIGEVRLKWTPPKGAVRYFIKRSTNADNGFEVIGESIQNTYKDRGLEEGQVYFYRVVAVNDNGVFSVDSDTRSIIPSTALKGLGVKQSGIGEVTITWEGVDSALGYLIYRLGEGRDEYEEIGEGKDTLYTDTGLIEGKVYHYRIRAEGPQGALSPVSDPVYITPKTSIADLHAEQTGIAEVELIWKGLSEVKSYIVYRRGGIDDDYKEVGGAEAARYMDVDLLEDRTYRYRVRGISYKGYETVLSPSYEIHIEPRVVTGVKARQTGMGEVEIRWEGLGGASHYLVYRSEYVNEDYNQVGESAVLKHIDNVPQSGKSYYYRVSAVNQRGLETGPSEVVSIPVEPLSVTDITLEQTGIGEVGLSWKDLDGAVNYAVLRGLKPEGRYQKIGITDKTGFTDGELEEGKTYYYRISGVNKAGFKSVPSNPVDILPATVLEGMEAKVIGVGTAEISWPPRDDIKRYILYRSPKKGGEFKKIFDGEGNSFIDSNLEEGKEYYYRLRGESHYNIKTMPSSRLRISVKNEVQNVMAKQTGIGKIKLSWDPMMNAAGYKVYYSVNKAGPPFNGKDAKQGPSPIRLEGEGNNKTYIANLKEGYSYYFSVTAYSSNTETSHSPCSHQYIASLIHVPEGYFQMGSDVGEGERDEEPKHMVYIDAFYMDKYEVTNKMYRMCVKGGGCSPPAEGSSYTRESYYNNPSYDDYPVIYVSWFQARDYCIWAGRRLPTEAEWEKAAKGADHEDRIYPWGDSSPDCEMVNFYECKGDTTRGGSYPEGASPFGVMDMAGNVWEWVNDWYNPNYYKVSPIKNPQGPSGNNHKVMRGGSWFYVDHILRVSNRYMNLPTFHSDDCGFRCLLILED